MSALVLLLFFYSPLVECFVPRPQKSSRYHQAAETFGPRSRHVRSRQGQPVSVSALTSADGDCTSVLRLDARELTAAAVASFERPVILTHAFDGPDGGLREPFNSEGAWCDRLMEELGQHEIVYQVKGGEGERVEYVSRLEEYVEALSDGISNHDEQVYMITEDLLDEGSAELREAIRLNESLFGPDLFAHFPSPVRPKDSCLIIGGEGARSLLHADCYEWTGLNALIEGRKHWSFLPPSEQSAHVLEAAREAPEAWDAEGASRFNISAGWRSPYDLYRHRRPQEPGMPPPPLRPDSALPADLPQPLEAIQEEGDLVIIPPGWWHQVYHVEPSVALAWQYVNGAGLDRVLAHVLRWCAGEGAGVEPHLPPSDWVPEGRIQWALREAMVLRHGRKDGYAMYEKMMMQHARGLG